MQHVRALYIPLNSIEVELSENAKSIGVQVFISENSSGRPVAIGFQGKAQKPDFYYSFKTSELRQKYIDEWIDNLIARHERKIAARKEKSEWQHNVKVGDIFKCSWGWEQTNIDYYEVVRVHGKFVWIREVAQDRIETHYLQGACVPVPGEYLNDTVQKKLVQKCGDYPCLKISSYSTAFLEAPVEVVPGVKAYKTSHWTAYA